MKSIQSKYALKFFVRYQVDWTFNPTTRIEAHNPDVNVRHLRFYELAVLSHCCHLRQVDLHTTKLHIWVLDAQLLQFLINFGLVSRDKTDIEPLFSELMAEIKAKPI